MKNRRVNIKKIMANPDERKKMLDGASEFISNIGRDADFVADLLESQFEYYLTGTGQPLSVHKAVSDCFKHGCLIHQPTNHVMRSFPTYWRYDRRLMERICPHGVGHPDPDGINFIKRMKGKKYAEVEASHGCDGCCLNHLPEGKLLEGDEDYE